MIAGTVYLEETTITFFANRDCTVTYTVEDGKTNMAETLNVPQDKFFKALAIAVHNDGMPEWEKDYPDAESIQGNIRWIP